ncbi:MAG: 2-amino-4-hydroxy-6-hydroxymethyldihydropteridine diphosphokinase [Candidatus Omnitrophota bacterium]|nr:2-amino-4-hydroxy-6-hydroxymethyldihydropteridine diphosphokinase [Candidatus Omnitrophota bacterium]
METVYLSMGSNRGEREHLLLRSCAMIGDRISDQVELSSFYESDPWGLQDPVSFYNLAVVVKTALSPGEVLKKIHEIEDCLGRSPRGAKKGTGAFFQRKKKRKMRLSPFSPGTHDGKRIYEPRTIDIDILFYGSKVIFAEDLMIPHPRLHERRFVLVPMAEIAPGLIHPVLKKTTRELLASCQDTGKVRRLSSL